MLLCPLFAGDHTTNSMWWEAKITQESPFSQEPTKSETGGSQGFAGHPLAEHVVPGSVRDPASKYEVKSDRERPLMPTSAFTYAPPTHSSRREEGREGGEEGERERGREFERGGMKTPLTTRVTAVWMLCPNDHKTQAE